jgi:hypothetical protein
MTITRTPTLAIAAFATMGATRLPTTTALATRRVRLAP